MHIALKGFLVGLAIAVFLLVFEYRSARSAAQERAKKMASTKVEITAEDRSRISGVLRFCFVIPPGMALLFWVTMG